MDKEIVKNDKPEDRCESLISEDRVSTEGQTLIDAFAAVPVVDGIAYGSAYKIEWDPYKVRIYTGRRSGEAVKEFDIHKVKFMGWPAEFTPGETFPIG